VAAGIAVAGPHVHDLLAAETATSLFDPSWNASPKSLGWPPTPCAIVGSVSVLFDANVAVAGDGYGQNTYANAQAPDGRLTLKARS